MAVLWQRRSLPERYREEWGTDFWAAVEDGLRDDVTVLDIGAGRQPTITPDRRPPNATYIGLDIDAGELETAPPGSYDETIAGPVEDLRPELVGRADLIVSWQVLEHVADMRRAASVMYRYLRPGGSFVGLLSGRNAVYSVANRVLPPSVGAHVVARLKRRPLETVFEAQYDRCTDAGLREAFGDFDEVDVLPHWRAANYFDRLRPLRGAYLAYENWAFDHDRRELATHYVVVARRVGATA